MSLEEILHEKLLEKQKQVFELQDEIYRLQSIIDKAIEYIGLNEEDIKNYDIYDVNGIELYKILKGSDKE